MQPKSDEPTTLLSLRAPDSWFERIDRWCERMRQEQGTLMSATRPAAIRYIVHQFLLQEEKRKPKKPSRARKASTSTVDLLS